MSEFPIIPEQNSEINQWFKDGSLDILREQLQRAPYPGYPRRRLSYADDVHRIGEFGRLYLPNGPWHAPTEHNEYVSPEMVDEFYQAGYQLDTQDRPLHPWINELLVPDIGVVTGKGFYRNFGGNKTGDPLIIRHDYREPLLLLIQRNDTGMWALPGGFVDPGETGEQTALREAREETYVDAREYGPVSTQIYCGPMADVRATANAWPETEAYVFHLNPELTKDLPLGEFPGNPEEVRAAGWFPINIARGQLFGSHNLLVELALRQTVS